MHPITALQMEWSLWTRDIEEEIIPLCRYIQFTDDVFLYFLVSWLFPCLRNLRRIHHWHVHQFLMWQCEHFKEIDCMYPKIKSLHFFLLFFLGIPILLSFLNDCYNKENCPFCVALISIYWNYLIQKHEYALLNLDAIVPVGSLELE